MWHKSLASVLLHVVFSTKQRRPLIADAVRDALWRYMAGICKTVNSQAYRIGGTQDHAHVLCSLPRTLTVSDLLEEVKKGSSRWIKTQGVSDFTWQAGYGAFSIGRSQMEQVAAYIDAQQQHHHKQTFQEEFISLLKKYQVPYDERYIWE